MYVCMYMYIYVCVCARARTRTRMRLHAKHICMQRTCACMWGAGVHLGKPCYKKMNGEWVLRWHPPRKEWLIDAKGLRDSQACHAYLTCDAPHPAAATGIWRVSDGKKFVMDTYVCVEVCTRVCGCVGVCVCVCLCACVNL